MPITYQDKEQLEVNPLPEENTWKADDANEVKAVVNALDADVNQLQIDVDNLETAVDDLETIVGSGSFWPLSGAADLTGNVTIDGNNYDFIIGAPNVLDNFNVYADAQIIFDTFLGSDESFIAIEPDDILLLSGDGVDTTTLNLTPNGFSVEANVGTPNSEGITHTTNGLLDFYSLSCDFLITGNWSVLADNALFHAFTDIDFQADAGDIELGAFGLISLNSDGVDILTASGGFTVTADSFMYFGLESGATWGVEDVDNNQAVQFGLGTGLIYDADYSGTFTDRSLPDCAWVNNQITGGGVFTGTISYSEIAPAQLTASVNNYSPGAGSFFYLTANAAWNITGWVPTNADGDFKTIYNGSSFDIGFPHQSGSSTNTNTYVIPGGGDYFLAPGKMINLIYSNTLNRWVLQSFT